MTSICTTVREARGFMQNMCLCMIPILVLEIHKAYQSRRVETNVAHFIDHMALK